MDKIIRSQKIKIYPTKEQSEILYQSCAASNYAWNWALNRWNYNYKNGINESIYDIRNAFVKEKNSNEKIQWIFEVSTEAFKNSILNVGNAWNKYFKKQIKGKPRFRKFNSYKKSYTETLVKKDALKVVDKKLFIPKFKKDNHIKTSENLRFNGRIKQVTISLIAGQWYASLTIECNKVPKQYPLNKKRYKKVGVDLGVKKLAVLSNGKIFKLPKKKLKELDNKITKFQRKLSKMIKDSKNYNKIRIKIQKLYKIKHDIILDIVHKLTNYLVRRYREIHIEDLNTSGLLKNHKLAKSIVESHFYEIKRQLEYKIKYLNERKESVDLIIIDRYFPSTQICSKCGCLRDKKDYLKLSDRTFICNECGINIDRDLNAAINIKNYN